MSEEDIAKFVSIGLTEAKAKETLKNANLTAALKEIINEAGVQSGCDKAIGVLLYQIATKPLAAAASSHRPALLKSIVEGKVKAINLPHAINYLNHLGSGAFDQATFEKESGVGVEITKDQVVEAVKKLLSESDPTTNKNTLIAQARQTLKFAEGKLVNDVFNEEYKKFFEEKKTLIEHEKEKKEKEKEKAKESEDSVHLPESVQFFNPKDNIQLRPEILEKHLAITGGVVVTRFPPEPNGFLHIGHAKAMNLNFGYSKKNGGYCYLRFDDTNPEAEKILYIESIKDSVEWFGYKPYQVTYASDYFPQLYEYAKDLIKRGKAYVCHQTHAQMKLGRAECIPSPWRDRPVEENLKLFEDMRKGKFKEGEAVLRMKGDMKNPNPCMRDIVAYRIKYIAHPHVGDKWCIYPSYDFTHCICDSIENITHSLCTLEFLPRRDIYNWLLDSLEIYRPTQIENARLNLTYTVLSKRKLIKLVEGGYVRGWDDPRIPTLNGFRRRGYRPQAIIDLCEIVGITKNESTTDFGLLEQCCRQDLDPIAPRAMAVLHPLKVVLTNYDKTKVEHLTVPNVPGDASKGVHTVPFSHIIYIDHSDFRLEDAKNYYGLAPNKEVGLRHSYNITCTEVIKNDAGEVIELRATVDTTKANKPKGHIHWVAQPAPGKEPTKVEVRLYSHLFTRPDIAEVKDDWLSYLSPDSLKIVEAYIDPSVADAKVRDRYQFERVGFFAVDDDSVPSKQVWNRIVCLKDGYAKELAKEDKKDNNNNNNNKNNNKSKAKSTKKN